MNKLRVLDLFSGIGGFSLGLERAGGFETVAFCEIEEFPRRVLRKHWPDVPIFEDVREMEGKDVGPIDVICGGFPCQDLSIAGPLTGLELGHRSGLWSEIVRLTCELRPRYVLVENVANLLRGPTQQRGGWFGQVLGDLAECGYDAEWQNIPASSVGRDQARERVWVIAYRNEIGWRRFGQRYELFDDFYRQGTGAAPAPIVGRAALERRLRSLVAADLQRTRPSGSRRSTHGVSRRLDRIGACGNSVVPRIPEMFGHAIMAAEGMA